MTRSRARDSAPVVDTGGTPSAGLGFGVPPSPTRRYDWEAIADRCKANPNQWYEVFQQDARSLVVALRQGSISAIRTEGGFEIKQANTKTDAEPPTTDLWLRYVPSNDTTKKKGGKR